MAKCEFCDKGVTFGIQVSHSHRRSNRPWKPNVKRVKAMVNGTPRHVYVCTLFPPTNGMWLHQNPLKHLLPIPTCLLPPHVFHIQCLYFSHIFMRFKPRLKHCRFLCISHIWLAARALFPPKNR